MKRVIAILLVFLITNTYAQDSTNKNPGILTKKIFGRYKVDGEPISLKKFEAKIYKVPDAIPFYKKSKNSYVIMGIGILATAGCLLLDRPDRVRYPKQHNGWYTAGLISLGVTYYYFFRSIKFLKKTMVVHNAKMKTIY